MKRFLRIVGTLVVVVLVLVVALAIAVPLLFDINDQKDRIATIVERETGRALTIDGDLELTVFPWLGVRTGAMSLAQASGFETVTPFAAFDSADARIKLVPFLLRREVQVGRIGLHGLSVYLERDADGRTNWSDLADRDDATPPTAPRIPRTEDDFDLENVVIEGFVLTGARIAYRDAQAGASYTVEDLAVATGAIRFGAPVTLSVDARVSSGVPQWRGVVSFRGIADYQHAAGTVALAIERASADLEGGALPVGRLQAVLAADIHGDLGKETWRVDGLTLDITARGGRLPDRDHPARVTGNVQADLAQQTATLRDLRFDGFGVRAAISADGVRIVDAPNFIGRATVQAFNPRQVLTQFGQASPDTKDPTALTHLEFAGDFVATRTSVALTALDARLDASQLTGRFAVADFGRQALRFDLALDQLDLDRYLPPETPETEDVPAGALDAIRIPDALVRKLDIDGSARLARLRALGLSSEDIRMTVRAANGLLRVNPTSAKLYGGEYTGDISVDVRGDVPRVGINERLAGVQAGALFADLFDEARIMGVADMSAQLTGSGFTIGEIRQTLDGRVSFSFRDGAVQGVDVWYLLRDARAVFRREERPEAPEGEPRTPFGSLSGTGVVRRGVMTNEDFRAQLPFMTAQGGGRLDLVKAEIDYRLRLTVQRTPGVEGNEGDGELRGKTIPVVIVGPLSEPAYGVDFAGILADQVRERADDARQRLEDRLREELRRRVR